MSNEVVGMLREKTEETDLDRVLQTRMGGYTKKSVQEYLTQLRRQQQNATDAFNRERQTTLEEKEKLQSENEKLRGRLLKAEADYGTLSRTVAEYKAENGELRMEDVLKLRSSLDVMEKDMDEAVARIQGDEQKIGQLQYELDDSRKAEQKAVQETAMYREMLASAHAEADGLRKTIAGQTITITQLTNDAKFLREAISEGKMAALQQRVTDLLGNVEKLQQEIETKNQELAARAQRLDVLTAQEQAHHRSLEQAQEELAQSRLQNEKLEAENQTLSHQMEELLQLSIRHYREESDLRVERDILQHRLSQLQLCAQAGAAESTAPAEPAAPAPAAAPAKTPDAK